ncbi:MAG: FAD-dependent oxidoreductase [Candidatus Cyclobacteriaceae bacterium M3_2C_046]
MKRRSFIKSTVISASSAGFLAHGSLAKTNLENNICREPARDIPVMEFYDVIVAGAGPAGVAAAIEAGRNGAKTLLVEVHGCLGGVWTSGLLSWILDQANKEGIMAEIRNRLIKMEAQCDINTGNIFAFDVEKMKLLLEELCLDAGVDILLQTRVVSTVKNSQNRLTHIITESKSGREAWAGKSFIDTTGDGDLAARAGCGYDWGGPLGQTQPMSLLALVSGIHFDEVETFVRFAGDKGQLSKRRLVAQIKAGGYNPSYQKPGLYPISKDLYMLMANHEYGYKGISAAEVTKATIAARKELHQIINALKSTGNPWQNIRLVATAEQIGVREGRRIHGIYTVSSKDLIEGARFDDAVCRVTFPVDVHSTSRENEDKNTQKKGRSYDQGVKAKPYDIPLRSLIAKDVAGLMMAGRCISGDFIAHSSYRVTGNAVAMGEAAGRVSAIAVKNNKLPAEVRWQETGLG